MKKGRNTEDVGSNSASEHRKRCPECGSETCTSCNTRLPSLPKQSLMRSRVSFYAPLTLDIAFFVISYFNIRPSWVWLSPAAWTFLLKVVLVFLASLLIVGVVIRTLQPRQLGVHEGKRSSKREWPQWVNYVMITVAVFFCFFICFVGVSASGSHGHENHKPDRWSKRRSAVGSDGHIAKPSEWPDNLDFVAPSQHSTILSPR